MVVADCPCSQRSRRDNNSGEESKAPRRSFLIYGGPSRCGQAAGGPGPGGGLDGQDVGDAAGVVCGVPRGLGLRLWTTSTTRIIITRPGQRPHRLVLVAACVPGAGVCLSTHTPQPRPYTQAQLNQDVGRGLVRELVGDGGMSGRKAKIGRTSTLPSCFLRPPPLVPAPHTTISQSISPQTKHRDI